MRNFYLVRTNTFSESPKEPYQPKIAGEGIVFTGGKCVVLWNSGEMGIFESLQKFEITLEPYIKIAWRDYESLLRAAKGLVNNWYEFDGPIAGFEERLHYFDEALKELEKELL